MDDVQYAVGLALGVVLAVRFCAVRWGVPWLKI